MSFFGYGSRQCQACHWRSGHLEYLSKLIASCLGLRFGIPWLELSNRILNQARSIVVKQAGKAVKFDKYVKSEKKIKKFFALKKKNF